MQVKMKLKFVETIVSYYNKISSNPIGKFILWGPATNFNLYILALKQFKNLLQNESLETISRTEKGKMLKGVISSWLLFCFINLIRRGIYLLTAPIIGFGAAGIIGLQKIIGITFPYSQESINKRDYNNDLSVSVGEAIRYEVVAYFKKAIIKFSADAGYTFTDAFWNFVLPPEITNPEQGLIFTGARDAIEFLVNLDPNENVNYATFRGAILGQISSKAMQGIKSGGQEIITGGGSSITVNNPTWSYGENIGTKRQIIINFDYNNTGEIKVDNKVVLNIRNISNKPVLIAPKNLSIRSIELTDNDGKKHILTKK
jgi:hypothetical protein